MRYSTLLLLVLLGLSACRSDVSTSVSTEQLSKTFELLLAEAMEASYGSSIGISVGVRTPAVEEGWYQVVGHDSKEKDQDLTINQPFRIASVTKTFVAVAILRLHEMGQLSINDPLSTYLPAHQIQILKGEGYDPDEIQIKHCLNHTSGLYDYAMGGPGYLDELSKNPARRWTREDQLNGAMGWGEATGEVGEKYSYGDTGYILLGSIIESFYADSLALGLRTLLRFDELGMEHTWLESLEPSPQPDANPVHRYHRQWETTDWDPSVDLYGGGGLMSTCTDLSTFIHALFNHQIFDQPETLSLMLAPPTYFDSYDPSENRRHKDYRYGIMAIELYGLKAYYHNGLWGTSMLHVPDLNTSVATNCTRGHAERLMKKIILAIKNAKEAT